jgi:hypothetical protein
MAENSRDNVASCVIQLFPNAFSHFEMPSVKFPFCLLKTRSNSFLAGRYMMPAQQQANCCSFRHNTQGTEMAPLACLLNLFVSILSSDPILSRRREINF